MLLQNGLDDVEPQAHALLVDAAGAVGLMEAVKDHVQFVRRNGLALILDGDVGLGALRRDGDGDGGAGGGKFGRVIQQIVAHLGDAVRIAPDPHRVVGDMDVHVQLTVFDLALQ